MFADDVIAEVFELLRYFARVGFVTNLKDHFDADSAERRKPYRTLMLNFDDVRSGLGDVIEQSGESARPVVDQKFQDNVAAFANEHLFDDPRKQRPVDVPAAQNGADDVFGRNFYLSGEQCRNSGGSGSFDDKMIVRHAVIYAACDLVFGYLDNFVNKFADDRQR